jgi:hypothetical protein
MFNAGVRGKRAKDGVGFLSAAEQFNQKSFLVPTVTSFSVTDVSYVPLDNTAVDTAGGETIVINGSGFASGATVQVGATTIGSVTFIDQNRLAFAAPALSSGSYTIYVTNSNGGTGILVSGLVYSGLPTYSTSAGSLGTVYETANINTSVTATGDAPITYTLLSGTLPSGATLNSNGTITGTAPVDGSSTTYSFTIQASDGQLQDSTRSFSLTINTDVLTWGLANNTVYTLEGNSVMSNVTLSATSTANSNSAVTFSANTLPTGVSLSGNTIFGTPTVEQTVYSALTATATQTGRTATRFVSWSVSLGDPFFKYVSLLLTGNSPVDTFVTDASTNNFPVTINGDTKPNNFNPFTPGRFSNFFDGTGDGLVSTNIAGNLVNTDFTWEAWVNFSSLASASTIIASGNSELGRTLLYYDVTNGLRYAVARTSDQVSIQQGSTSGWTTGTWYHVALVRTGNNYVLYRNGISIATGTNAYAQSELSQGLSVGYSNVTGSFLNFTGFISNARVVNGTAVYTSAFTPSTTPLTAISGTRLLTCQSSRLVDASNNAFAITAVGDVASRTLNPFVPDPTASTYGSGYFDGTGDYLTFPSTASAFGTGNFTIEAWVYFVSFNPIPVVFDTRSEAFGSGNIGLQLSVGTNGSLTWFEGEASTVVATAAASVVINTWQHIACVRSGTSTNQCTIYVNGVSKGTGTSTLNHLGYISYISRNAAAVANFVNGYISNFRIVKGTAVYTSAFTPPTVPLTAVANTSLLTLQTNQAINNNLFIDDSTNNFAVTRVGNTTQGTFSPYGSNWSNYFDGTGDYLTVPVTASGPLDFGSGNWTVEAWVMYTGASLTSAYRNFLTFCNDSGLPYIQFGTKISTGYVFAEEGTQTQITWSVAGTTLLTSNVWHHIAAVRNGNIIYLYLNGVLQGSVAYSAAHQTFAKFQIGSLKYNGSIIQDWNGYISNARVVKGTAVYTSAFTPPTAPLTAISGTSLLTCADNRFIDDSTNNFAITKFGDTSVQRFSPFSPSAAYSLSTIGGSGYFDGTGDFLSVPANAAFQLTGDFTLEAWVYPTVYPAGYPLMIFSCAQGSSADYLLFDAGSVGVGIGGNAYPGWTASIPLRAWTHIALTRSGTTLRAFANGVQLTLASGSATNSSQMFQSGFNFLVGQWGHPSLPDYMNGYISNARVVKGMALYTAAFTPPTAPVTANTNTSLLLNFTDAGVVDNAMMNDLETVGDARVSRAVSKFGSGAMFFDGTGDYLKTPSSPNLGFGTGDFTVECWINTSTKNIVISDFRTSNSEPGVFFIQSTTGFIGYYDNTVGSLSGTTNVTTGVWFHLAWTRSGTTFRMFVNGTQEYSGTNSGNFGASRPAVIGASWEISAFVNGYIDDLRITKGVARYTANFTPPTAAFQTK